jgi:metallo-beta-lactamase class B
MTSRQASVIVVSAVVAALAAGSVLAQQAPARRDVDAEIQAALQAAKTAAGFEFLGTLVRTCLLPQSGGEDTRDNAPGYVANPASAPARETWYADPAKVFDNLYFVGGKIHSAWALTTSEGIILIDTIFPYNSEELIVRGLEKLGLDPGNIKYLLISHAHGDHIGGAEMLQARYKPRVVMGEPDWVAVERFPNRYKTMAPKRDIVATDGMRITLGGTAVTIWHTPGHTPGTLSYTFTVLDRGKPLNVAYSGGTAFNFVNNTPDPGIRNFQTYIDSQKRMAEKARASGATVLLSNHSEFDNAVNKNRMLAGRGNGPHPYEVGAEGIQRYFEVMQGCARAAQLRLEQRLESTARR